MQQGAALHKLRENRGGGGEGGQAGERNNSTV